MTVSQAPFLKFRGFDNNGGPLAGGLLFTYAAGSTTKLATFTDSTGGTPNANPVVLNTRGECDLFLTSTSLYKLVLSPSTDTDPPTNPFWTEDNVVGIANSNSNFPATLALSSGSSLVGYQLPGAGTVATTVQTKLSEFVNIFDFMTSAQIADVKANTALVDVTAAVQAAINFGANKIYAPAGTYLLTSTITITTGITLIGDGRLRTIFKQATNFNVLTLNGAADAHLEAFQIINSLGSAAVTSGDGIRAIGSSYMTFTDLLITNTFNGIHLSSSPILRANSIDIGAFHGSGLRIDGGVNNFDDYFLNCTFSAANGGINNGVDGVYLADFCDEMTFYSCIMNFGTYLVYTTAVVYSTGVRPEYCRFTSCSFDSSTSGVWLDQCTDVTFTGCFFSSRPGSGCTVGSTNSESVSFLGSTFFNNGANGCLVLSGAKQTSFETCNVVGNSTASANASFGLYFSNCTDFSVKNCTLKNGWGSSGSQAYGILINSNPSTRYTITGNIFGTNGAGPLIDGTTGTVERYYANNIGFRTKQYGVAQVASGATTVVVTHGLALTPSVINLTLTGVKNGIIDYYASSIGATTFTITVNGAPSAITTFNWIAETLV